jgi:hypothetical protein
MTQGDPTGIAFSASYAWSYSDPEGRLESGSWGRRAGFDLATRRCATPADLDECDRFAYRGLAVWFWIPPDVQPGTRVQLLNEDLTVGRPDASLWQGLTPRQGIRVDGSGIGSRQDPHGSCTFTWRILAPHARRDDVGFHPVHAQYVYASSSGGYGYGGGYRRYGGYGRRPTRRTCPSIT